ncbi:hypothetical protein [Bacillus sp. V5-8f]|uniref:hypothetical protein n=1 Tax=Bacillus sp. V5-8f TaxID=2053044 RepID=UPI000C76ED47|nr:hypothetical protein [Bacillus sp. V5-8f]PLT35669.1 hypothetical protein CUU64_03465 [Bacillus sp. V5-8f]
MPQENNIRPDDSSSQENTSGDQPLMSTGASEAGFDWGRESNQSPAFESSHLRRNGLISRIGTIRLNRNSLGGQGRIH